ncbi:MAG: hypothetical protein Q8P42_07555 [Gallionella sp.]|nr:hypothetical protein [Gallionella sp.]
MYLLLTTSQSILALDTDSGELCTIDRGRGLYYGIARNGDKIYVAARNRLVSSPISQHDERGEILIFDNNLKSCGSLCAPFSLRDMHEIAWHGGKLWATCSFDNMIALFDGERWEQWYPLGAGTDGPCDANHFNSLMFDRDRVWILAHNRGASELLAFSLHTRELVERIEIGNCGHNIWRENGQLFTCSSGEGKLLGDHGFMLQTGGFPRGIAFDGDIRCVGISELAERGERDFTSGKLMIFGLDWKLQKEIELPGEGLVLDMLPLPVEFLSPLPSPLGETTSHSTRLQTTVAKSLVIPQAGG